MKKLIETQLVKLCQVAKEAAVSAGLHIQSQFDQHYLKQHKEGGDSLASQVVTAVDIKAQEIILKVLQESMETFDLGLLTEELTDNHSRTRKDYFWCIDPLDGTLPFTERRTGYAVSIALITREGDPVIGVVYIPDLEECYTAVKGDGVYLNDQKFIRKTATDDTVHVYMDISFKSEPYYDFVKAQLPRLVKQKALRLAYHYDYGGVRNALGVMSSGRGVYFKFPKNRKGCGSIWDYAATRLFFEEMALCVSSTHGEWLNLNNPHTTFMNEVGILYATDEEVRDFVGKLYEEMP